MLFASATPIVSGRTARYRDVGRELQPHLARYEELNGRYEVSRHAYWISHAHDGTDIGVSVYEISAEGLTSMRTREWEPASSYDAWWLDFVRDVNGVDMLRTSAHREPPEQVFAWSVE
jgi:hypothetical protein